MAAQNTRLLTGMQIIKTLLLRFQMEMRRNQGVSRGHVCYSLAKINLSIFLQCLENYQVAKLKGHELTDLVEKTSR